ncbi:CusA/CzcA family heavy metal efflux RND transporter [Echinicola vietnamensis]|uniref:Heavy metal efflux pump, cobalt-zinc-cadmium n=1 Tax=Echinicola vietnamensis (strain DSM 17526 / LMG 23754 / KMM 6221) TaxID=926556 RepID=L0G491_ECHVK|nr:CusA/CzcA family heavy metal efflux RND transporter [Echinicola vietnamensis]AGA79836.1 heavy metal efflux pump, cobalt-zinc-cadmium [Echinicola vietnamensis DSM 17526]
MINRLITFSIKNKLIIGLFTLALIGLGVWSMLQVPIDAVPDITNNQVQVITQAPNLGTEDIEQFVTYPVELAMANLPGVKEVRSVSRFGLSVVTIVFEDDQGTYLPRQLVAEKLNQVRDEIPDGFGKPSMGPISTGLGEIYQYTLEVDSAFRDHYTLTQLRTIQDWIVKRQMAMVPGVVEVNAFGGKIKQYEVAVDPDELSAIGISISDIYAALAKNNQNTGGAYIERNHHANFIRGEGLVRSLDDIRNITVANQNGIPLKIKDVAEVRFGHAVRYGAFTKNGKGEAVGGMILMLKGANSEKVITAVKERINQIQQSLPEGVRIKPFLDRSDLVKETTATVSTNLLEGGLIVVFVLVLLLGNWRGGLIVASTIPLSLLFAFIMMNAFGVWANLMSLGAIDFGIIVDGAVIIVESSVYYLHQKIPTTKLMTAKDRDKQAALASKKMMNAAFFGQLIILIVFLPILALEGVEGKMFRPMALTFIFAMLGAMILCLTYVPMMSAAFIRVAKPTRKSWGDKVIMWLESKYVPLLEQALKKGKWIVGMAIVLFGTTCFLFKNMGGEFIPQLDEGDIAFHIMLAPGSSLSESVATSTRVEKIILENFPEVEQVMSRFGVADVPTDPMPMDIGDCFVILKPQDEWVSASSKEELIEKIKAKISVIPGVNYEFTQPIEMRFNELLTGVREDIAIKLFGEDLDILAAKANSIGQLIQGIDGVADLRVEATTGLPQMTIRYDREKLAQYDLDVSALNTIVQTAFAGKSAGAVFEGEKRFDLVIRQDASSRKSIEDIKNLYVNISEDYQIPLKEVAEISYKPGPMQISRDNTNRRTYVGINVRGRDVASLVKEIQDTLEDSLELPPGYYIRYGGAFENFERASKRLQLVVPVALASIFILIFFALNSLKQTLMIYMAIPLAAVGGIGALWLRDMPFSISAGVGFIVLFGVAVLNGLVLINGLNELKEAGHLSLLERIKTGTKRRIRPILLTAVTDILGFLPMAISQSAGAEVQRPLATVVIGGLLTATLLTLFLIPILYQWLESSQNNMKAPKAGLILMVLWGAFLLPTRSDAQNMAQSQPITLDEAIARAHERYPLLEHAQLEIEKQTVLKKKAWDFGNTQVYTGGEEVKDDLGVYTTIGIQQQQMDIFGISAKSTYQQEKVSWAEASKELSAAALTREVSIAFVEAYLAKQQYALLDKMDSLYGHFERAARIRYETQTTSKLEWLSAQNKAKQVAIQKEQSHKDYLISLKKFNLWLVSDTLFTVQANDPSNLLTLGQDINDMVEHPQVLLAKRDQAVAAQGVKVAKTGYLPKLYAQYGLQEIQGISGFTTFQLGISIPLAFHQNQADVRSAKLEVKQANQKLLQTKMELNVAMDAAREQFLKWKSAVEFYESEALPLAKEQERGALLAYQEGAIDYVTFLQNINDALTIEQQAQDSLKAYLLSKITLQYYTHSTPKQDEY